MATSVRLHPYSFNPWLSQQSLAENPYGAYYPLPVTTEAAAQRVSKKPKFGSNSRPPRLPLNGGLTNKKVTGRDAAPLRRKPMKKQKRKGPWRRRHHHEPTNDQNRAPDDRTYFPPEAYGGKNRNHAATFPRVPGTPSASLSSSLCLEDAAQLNVNPYGTMAGMLVLEQEVSPLFLQNEERQDESSVDGPSSSASEGGPMPAEPRMPSPRGAIPHLRVSLFDHLRHGDTFLRARLEEQEVQMNQLEEENLTLKEKLFLVEQELEELRRRTSGSGQEEVEGDNSVIWGGAHLP